MWLARGAPSFWVLLWQCVPICVAISVACLLLGAPWFVWQYVDLWVKSQFSQPLTAGGAMGVAGDLAAAMATAGESAMAHTGWGSDIPEPQQPLLPA